MDGRVAAVQSRCRWSADALRKRAAAREGTCLAGTGSTQKVLMRILPPGPAGVGAEVHQGPFAWASGPVARRLEGGTGRACAARFVVDTRTLDVEASATSGPEADIWTLRELQLFAARKQHGDLAGRRVAWYGKLPARGDFVGRGLPPRWRSDWDDWLQRGLALAAAEGEGAMLRERLRAFAPWRYLALPAPAEIWCGIMVASHDRVGRAFPVDLGRAPRRTGLTGRKCCPARVAA